MKKSENYLGTWTINLKSQRKHWTEGLFDLTIKTANNPYSDHWIQEIDDIIQHTIESKRVQFQMILSEADAPQPYFHLLRFRPMFDVHQRMDMIAVDVYNKVRISTLLKDPSSPVFIFRSVFSDRPYELKIFDPTGKAIVDHVTLNHELKSNQPPPETSQLLCKHINNCPEELQQTFKKVIQTKRFASVQIKRINEANELKIFFCIYEPILNEQEEVLYVYNYNFDITDYHKREDLVFNQFLAMEASMDGIALINEHGEFYYLNHRFSEILDLKDDKVVLGKKWQTIPSIQGLPTLEKTIAGGLANENKWLGEITIKCVNTTTYAELAFEILPNKNMVCIVRDVTEQKHLQLQLELDHRILSQTFSMIVITDADHKIEWVNEAFTKVSGYTLEEVKGKNPGSFLQGPDTDTTTVGVMKEQLQKNEPFHCELLNYSKDGIPYWIEIKCQPLLRKDGTVEKFFAIEEDITFRKKSLEEIRKNEERLKHALEGSISGFWDWNITDNKVFFSSQWKKMLGYQEDEISDDFLEFKNRLHPEDEERVTQTLNQYLEGKTNHYECEFRLRDKAGAYHNRLDRGSIIEWDREGKPMRMIGSNIDITPIVEAQEKIRVSEQRLKQALDASGNGIWDWDLETDETIYSPQWARMLGYEPYEIENNGDACRTRIHPEDHPGCKLALDNYLNGKTDYYECQQRLLAKDGSYIWTIDRGLIVERTKEGKPKRVIGTNIDVSALKKAEEQLRMSEERWKSAIEGSGVGIWEINMADETIWYSPRALELLGYSEQDAGPKTLGDFRKMVHPEDVPAARKKMEDHIAGRIKYYINEYRIQCKNGSYRWFALHGVLTRNINTGVPMKFIGSCYDITDRKDFEKKLIISEERWKKAIEGSGAGIGEINWIERKIWYSLRAAQMLGYEHAEELPDSLDYYISLIHPDDVTETITALEAHIAGNTSSFEYEYRIRCKNGLYRWFDFHGMVTARSKRGEAITFIGSAYDITTRKEFEEKLKVSEERWKFAIDGAEAGIWDWDLTNDRVYYSEMAKRMHGITDDREYYSGSEMMATSFHPDDRNRILQGAEDLINNKKDKLEFEHRLGNEQKGFRWIRDRALVVARNNQGKATRIIGIFFDITEQKELYQKLEESEERWIFALEGAASGVWDYNLSNGDVFYSKKFKELLGFQPEDDFNNDLNAWQELMHPEDVEKERTAMINYFKGVTNLFELEVRVLHKDGTYHWFLNQGIIVSRNAQGDVSRMIGTATDITQRKKAELELIKAKEMAEASSKTKRAFLANMSHEIRTPMNAILGLSEQLKQTSLNDDQQFLTDIISDAAKNLQVLIDDILDFSKIEEGKLKLENIGFDLHDLLTRNINMLLHKAQEKNISLRLDYDSNIHSYVKSDPNRLNQILINIMGNAIKFTGKGYVKISCKLKSKDEHQQWISFNISDTGIGISEEGLRNIFNEFYQEDQTIARKYGGTGLGLAISNNLVQMMGGNIHIESKKNTGTSVVIELPFEMTHLIEASVIHESMHYDESMLAQKKILLVEDNKVNRIVATIILRKHKLIVEEAENGKEALVKLEKSKYDLILMDLQMPEMDGITAVQHLRAKGITTPVIALTANAVREELEELIPIGFNDYVIKPFEEAKLLHKIQEQTHIVLQQGPKKFPINLSGNLSKQGLYRILQQNAGNNASLVTSLCEAMKSELRSSLEKLDIAIDEDDVPAIKRIAHKQKSMFASLGLNEESACVTELSGIDLEKYNPVKVRAQSETMKTLFEKTYQSCKEICPDQ